MPSPLGVVPMRRVSAAAAVSETCNPSGVPCGGGGSYRRMATRLWCLVASRRAAANEWVSLAVLQEIFPFLHNFLSSMLSFRHLVLHIFFL